MAAKVPPVKPKTPPAPKLKPVPPDATAIPIRTAPNNILPKPLPDPDMTGIK